MENILLRLKEILLESDITLASFMLGWGLFWWGIFAFFLSPQDFSVVDTQNVMNMFWFFNYVGVGLGYVYVAYRKFPSMTSMLIGGYSCVIWTWVAAMKSTSSNLTSGITLNLIVIAMGILLIQRSGENSKR
jgi:hypothetical protein